MGMQSRINLYAVSKSPIFLESLGNFLKQDNEINLSGCYHGFNTALKHLNNKTGSLQNNNIVLIDDLSFNNIQTVNFLNNFNPAKRSIPGGFRLNGIKTIVYTDSVDAEYLNDLWLTNTNSILHDKETSLIDFFAMGIVKQDTKSGLNRDGYLQAGGRLIETIKMVSSNISCYDSIVRNILSRRDKWALDDKNDKDVIQSRNALHLPELSARRKDTEYLNKLPAKPVAQEASGISKTQISKRKKIRALFLTAVPVIAAGIISLFSDDAFINLDTKKYTEIDTGEKSELVNYNVIIYDDNNNPLEQESLLNKLQYNKHNHAVTNKEKTEPKIIIYTRSDNILCLRRLVETETAGLLHKTSSKKRIIEALNETYEGNNYVDPTIDKKISEYNKYLSTCPLSKITHGQLKVLNEISNAWKNQRIAEKLSITVDAVEKHKTSMMLRLEIKAEELSHFAVKNREDIKYLLEFPLTALRDT